MRGGWVAWRIETINAGRYHLKEPLPRMLVAVAAAVVVLGLHVGVAPACGCGIALGASGVSETALVTYHDGVETIIPGLRIDHVQQHAALILPVPGAPRVRALPADADPFGELAAGTAPKPVSTGPPGVAGAAPPTPTVVSSAQIGGYHVSVLRGGTGETLYAWLRSHGFTLPRSSRPIIGHYIAQRWYFVAIQLPPRRHAGTAEIRPLAVAFRSAQIVYPMRLSALADGPVSATLYFNADSPVTVSGIDGLRVTYSGTVASLGTLTPAVRRLLPAHFVTKVKLASVPPSSIHEDIVAGPLASATGGGVACRHARPVLTTSFCCNARASWLRLSGSSTCVSPGAAGCC